MRKERSVQDKQIHLKRCMHEEKNNENKYINAKKKKKTRISKLIQNLHICTKMCMQRLVINAK